jgi:hypothetical protein
MDHSQTLRTVLVCLATVAGVWAGPAWTESIGGQLEPAAGRWGTWAIFSGSTMKARDNRGSSS